MQVRKIRKDLYLTNGEVTEWWNHEVMSANGKYIFKIMEELTMLVSAKEMLDKAKAGHYAVGQFC